MTSTNQAIAKHASIAAEFLYEYAAKLPNLYSVDARTDKIEFQVWASGSTVENMQQASEALKTPVVVTNYEKFYRATVTTNRDGIDIHVWDHFSLTEVMKLFLRLGIDPETKVVELDAETLAKAVESPEAEQS